MKRETFLLTHDDLACSPTEEQPYHKVNPKVVKENINTPIAKEVTKMLADTSKDSAMKHVIAAKNNLKIDQVQLQATMNVALEVINFIEPESSFEEKLAQRLKGEKKNVADNTPTSAKKNSMAPR